MAVISPTQITTPFDGPIKIYKWASLTEADTAAAINNPRFNDKTIQVVGTFGGGTIDIEGSVIFASPTFAVLTDPQGSAASFTGAGIKTVLQNVYWLRPNVSAGTGVSVDVYLLVK